MREILPSPSSSESSSRAEGTKTASNHRTHHNTDMHPTTHPVPSCIFPSYSSVSKFIQNLPSYMVKHSTLSRGRLLACSFPWHVSAGYLALVASPVVACQACTSSPTMTRGFEYKRQSKPILQKGPATSCPFQRGEFCCVWTASQDPQ